MTGGQGADTGPLQVQTYSYAQESPVQGTQAQGAWSEYSHHAPLDSQGVPITG